MARRIKKPAVKPEVRRQWFRRHEKEGESPPHIAESDGYDVRTVRKQIEIEHQERERREARSIVLRQALEQHYADLCAFAQKLDSQVTNTTDTIASLKEDRMWSSLREHLPRSVLWKNLDKRTKLTNELLSTEHNLKKIIEEQIESRSKRKVTSSLREVGFNNRAIDAIMTNARLVNQEKQEILGYADFESNPDGKEFTTIGLGNFYIGKFHNTRVPEIQKLVSDLLHEVATWEESDDMRRLLLELDQVNRVLRGELAVIILRRVVPGRCKYCPI